ncbi:MAG: terminase family protein [Spirochaetales bacterium]|nr:terminase family protein [Spirochaetales bacterium]
MANKPTNKGKKPKTKHDKSRDWDAIREDWHAADGYNLKEWCKLKGLPPSTASKHLSVKAKRAERKRRDENVQAFRKILEDAGKGEPDQVYNNALRQSIALVREIMLQAGIEFRTALEYSHAFKDPASIGRLAISAAAELREISLEYQGLPDDDEEYTWPLTKNFWPHDYQRDFIFDLPSNLRRRGVDAFVFAFIGGIRSGKTRCGAEKFAHMASLNRGRTLAMYAPTYRMLRDSTKKTFLEVLENKGIGYVNRKSDNAIILFGDTTILCRSLDKPDRNRGTTLAGAWMDEVGQMRNREAYDIVYGRVSDPEAVEPFLIISTTPDGMNWAYDVLVEEGVKNKVRLYNAHTDQNISLDVDYAERMKGVYDPKFAKQELAGEFIDVFSGKTYWNFSRQANVIPEGRIPYDPMRPLILMFDLNVDPMCWNIAQRHTKGRDYIDVILDEIHMRTASTEEAAREFLARYSGQKGGVLIHGDATARNKTTVTTRTDYEVIKEVISEELPLIEIRIGKTNPRVTDRVAAMNARLKDGKGQRKLFLVKEKCRETIKDLEQVAFKPGTRDLDKTDPKRTHHTDAIGYYINREYPVRRIKRRAA